MDFIITKKFPCLHIYRPSFSDRQRISDHRLLLNFSLDCNKWLKQLTFLGLHLHSLKKRLFAHVFSWVLPCALEHSARTLVSLQLIGYWSKIQAYDWLVICNFEVFPSCNWKRQLYWGQTDFWWSPASTPSL